MDATNTLVSALSDVGADPDAQRAVFVAVGGHPERSTGWPSIESFYLAGQDGRFSLFVLTTSGALIMFDADREGNSRTKMCKVDRVRQVYEERVKGNLNLVLELDAGAAVVERFDREPEDPENLHSAGTFKPHVWVLRATEEDTVKLAQLGDFSSAIRAALVGA